MCLETGVLLASINHNQKLIINRDIESNETNASAPVVQYRTPPMQEPDVKTTYPQRGNSNSTSFIA